MYENFYGLVEKPFNLTPDPKYLFRSESHSEAYDLLQYAIRRREGFVVITGDIGTGKTTLCRAILRETDRKTFTALVLNPFLSEEDLLRQILQDFGVVSRDEVRRGLLAGVSKPQLVETLYDFLLSLLPLNAGAVVVIDEAQNLPPHVLEQIRILSNLETDKEKLLQIVLVGQPNLLSLLQAPEMRQLDQRVSIRCALEPLTRAEVAAYIAHRLKVAGGAESVEFTPKAIDRLRRQSGGIPRLINLLCDRALLAGYAARTGRISPELVAAAAESLDLARPASRSVAQLGRRVAVPVAAAATAAAIAVVGAGLGYRRATILPSVAEVEALGAPTTKDGGRVLEDRTDGGGVQARDDGTGQEPYSILIGSFRDAASVATAESRLRQMGYRSYRLDLDAGGRGRLTQVLVGGYADAGQAMDHESRLRRTPGFDDARLVVTTAAPATTP
jgi:general secretion pathway protein A